MKLLTFQTWRRYTLMLNKSYHCLQDWNLEKAQGAIIANPLISMHCRHNNRLFHCWVLQMGPGQTVLPIIKTGFQTKLKCQTCMVCLKKRLLSANWNHLIFFSCCYQIFWPKPFISRSAFCSIHVQKLQML